MTVRYDRNIGARVYDPSEGGGGTAMDGTAMQRAAEALGFYNEAGDLGTAAHFGNPQMAAQVLAQLFQGEQAARQQRNQRELMAMQQAGQAATAEAKLRAAQQESATNRDMTRWGKQGDWQRYDKQNATQLLRQLGIDVGKDRRAEALNEARIRAENIRAGAKQSVAETGYKGKQYTADRYGQSRENVAGIQGKSRENVAGINAGSREKVATTQAEAKKYGYDRTLEGVLHRADTYLEANKYRADRDFEGRDLVSGRNLEGTKYRADRDLEGKQSVANINAQSRERVGKMGGSPTGSGSALLKIKADLDKKRADILSKPAPKLQDRSQKIREKMQWARANNQTRADGKPLTLSDVANYVDAEHERAWKSQQQTAIEQIDLRQKELEGIGQGPQAQPTEAQPVIGFPPIFGLGQ